MEILVLGVGEAADPDHPNSSLSVAHGGYRVMIDCGHSVPPVLWRSLPEPGAVDALCFTHHHPDHCFGLVPALIRWSDDGRRKPLEVVTTGDGRHQLSRLLAAGGLESEHALGFPLRWRPMPDDGETAELGPFRLRSAATLHAVPNRALRLEAGGRSVAWSGDGRPTAESEALFRGADRLFHECYTVEPEPGQPFHAALGMLADAPARLGVGALSLYHVRRDQRAVLAAACAGLARVTLARAGERILLG